MSVHSSRSKSSSSGKNTNNKDNHNSQNSKVYVSNIHRDAQEEEIRQMFSKFGQITYFAMKRKPDDVIYAFIQYKSADDANQAVLKMNRTNFNKRTLNVQFGRGGKHQQQHYQTINMLPSKNREYSEKGFNKPDGIPFRRPHEHSFDRRREQFKSHQRRNNDDRKYRRSISPSQENLFRSKRQFKDERPSREFNPRKYDNQRNGGYDRDSRKKLYEDDKYRRQQKSYRPLNYSPKGEKPLYQDHRRNLENRKYDDRQRQGGEFRLKQKSRYQQYPRRENSRFDDIQRNREKYPGRDRYDRQRSPNIQRYSRHNRQDQRKQTRFEDRPRYQQHRMREQYEKRREHKRSRSREKSPHKHRSHRKQKYQNEQFRRQHIRHQKYPRGSRSPILREQERRRLSRSNSPYKIGIQRKYRQRKPNANQYQVGQHRRYSRDQYKPLNPQTMIRQNPRINAIEQGNGYRKGSKVSRDSRSMSEQKYKQKDEQSDLQNYKFSSQKQASPKLNPIALTQIKPDSQLNQSTI